MRILRLHPKPLKRIGLLLGINPLLLTKILRQRPGIAPFHILTKILHNFLIDLFEHILRLLLLSLTIEVVGVDVEETGDLFYDWVLEVEIVGIKQGLECCGDLAAEMMALDLGRGFF